jgi:hypothetical protein
VRHERRRDGAFNLFALKRTVADGNDLAVNAYTGRSSRHQQKIAATTLDELTQPAIDLSERIGHTSEITTAYDGSSVAGLTPHAHSLGHSS